MQIKRNKDYNSIKLQSHQKIKLAVANIVVYECIYLCVCVCERENQCKCVAYKCVCVQTPELNITATPTG